MRTYQLTMATAAMAVIFALGACNRNGASPPPAADAASNAATSSSPAVAGAEGATAAGVGAAATALPASAQDFVTAAATSDMYEVKAAKIAEAKSKDPEVKRFAGRMIHDHTHSTELLKALLAGGAVKATAPTDLDERRKGLIGDLDAATPANFDKTYVDQQVAAHQEAANLFENYAKNGDNAGLKNFASAVLPTIRTHLTMAQQMQTRMK
jgi:putative membrane protein